MTERRRHLVARLILLAFVVLAGLRLATLDYGAKISTNVIDLIPADEREPELHVLRTLANERQARVVLLALSAPDAARAGAADAFIASLAADPAFAEVRRADDPEAREALGRFFFERSADYLLPGWIERRRAAFGRTGEPASAWTGWLAARTVAELDAYLHKPESAAFQDLIPSDPLLLLPTLASSARLAGGDAPGGPGGHALIWALIADSPLEPAGQQPVFDAIDRALASARTVAPETGLRWTGVNRFAAASETRIRSEISLLNALSISAVLMVSVLLIRRPWHVLHLLPVILCSLAGAWLAVTAIFDRLHILVFVVGALLTGAAIDYGFHLFLHAEARAGEGYGQKIRRVLRPLLLSCFTTVAGFGLLLMSELPLIRHLGVFVAAGLFTAVAAAVAYHAQYAGRPFEARRLPALPAGPRVIVVCRIVVGLAALTAIAGVSRLEWHDDIRELEVPTPLLDANDAEVNALFGDPGDRAIYLTGGDDLADARTRLDAFTAWHREQFPGSELAGAALMIPSPAAHAALPDRLRELSGFPDALRGELRKHGYLPEAFEPFFNSWERARARAHPDYDQLVAGLRPLLVGPMSMLINEGKGRVWFASISGHPPGETPPPPELQTVATNQLRTLNRLFSRYRASALRLSLIGLGVTGLAVVLLYGPRRGLRIYAIPVGACFVTFGALGLAGATLNLFHLLGVFLGVCLSHDYAIFSAETRAPGQPPPASIRLSALTTMASFGVLAFSQIPVIAALGATVGMSVLVALAAVELDAVLRTRRPA
ncbi:MAG: MMPL family transporter [Verrucomicrobiota bacterium]